MLLLVQVGNPSLDLLDHLAQQVAAAAAVPMAFAVVARGTPMFSSHGFPREIREDPADLVTALAPFLLSRVPFRIPDIGLSTSPGLVWVRETFAVQSYLVQQVIALGDCVAWFCALDTQSRAWLDGEAERLLALAKKLEEAFVLDLPGVLGHLDRQAPSSGDAWSVLSKSGSRRS